MATTAGFVKAPSSLVDTVLIFGQGQNGTGLTSAKNKTKAPQSSYTVLFRVQSIKKTTENNDCASFHPQGKENEGTRKLLMAREPTAIFKIQMTQR